MPRSFARHKAVYSLLLISISASPTLYAMQALTDEEMSRTAGQALYHYQYTQQGGLGFYRMGLQAEMEMNLNIRKLQLGCGGVNAGAGKPNCDLDIDYLSLSGQNFDAGGNPIAMTREDRVGSSATVTNPFFEIAVKNPTSASTREIAGIRFSAEKLQGLLTAGLENTGTPNGINSLSGFLRIQSDSSGYVYGRANTGARDFIASSNASYTVNGVTGTYNNQVTGKVKVTGLGFLGGAIEPITFQTIDGGFKIPRMDNIPFIRSGIVVNSNRITSLPLKATLNVPSIKVDWRNVYPANGQTIYHNPVESPIDWGFNVPREVQTQGGSVRARITDCGFLACIFIQNGDILQSVMMKGSINNIVGDVTINQGLGYIHHLPIRSAGYLSVQSQDIRWPGSYSGPNPENPAQTVTDIAKKGWWLSMSDPINLGSVDPTKDIDIAPLFPQIAQQITTYLMNENNAASLNVNQLGNVISGAGDVNVTIGNLNVPTPLVLTLTDLQLNGQGFQPNCYGTLSFC
jgi:hypothetical protein